MNYYDKISRKQFVMSTEKRKTGRTLNLGRDSVAFKCGQESNILEIGKTVLICMSLLNVVSFSLKYNDNI